MNKQDKIKSQYMGSFKWFKCFKWENLWKWVEDCVCLNSALAGKWCKWALVSIGENWWLLVSIGDYWWAFVSIGEYWSLLPARKGMKRNVYLSSNIIEELILLLQVFCGWKSERGKKAPLKNCSVDILRMAPIARNNMKRKWECELPEKVWCVLRDEKVGGPKA